MEGNALVDMDGAVLDAGMAAAAVDICVALVLGEQPQTTHKTAITVKMPVAYVFIIYFLLIVHSKRKCETWGRCGLLIHHRVGLSPYPSCWFLLAHAAQRLVSRPPPTETPAGKNHL